MYIRRVPYRHINQRSEHTEQGRAAAVPTGALLSSSPLLCLPLWERSLSPGMKTLVANR